MLEKILKNCKLEDAIQIEQQDRQFLALKKLYENKKIDDELYLLFIILNALISFQLSGKGEDYWEEFAENLIKFDGDVNYIYIFFEKLLREGKNNRRFVDMKLKRIEKMLQAQKDFSSLKLKDWEFYYKNMGKLVEDLVKVMSQKKDAKTIVFAVKMFSYGARNVFGYLEYFPFDLAIPVDSRIEKLYELENGKGTKKQIKQYYSDLAEKIKIPPLHLDAILWVNYDDILNSLMK